MSELEKSRLNEIAADANGVQYKTVADMWTYANMVFKSGLAPQSFKNPQQVLIAMQYGAELGMSGPMTALKSLAVVNGAVSIWGDAVLARAFKLGSIKASRMSWRNKSGLVAPEKVPTLKHEAEQDPSLGVYFEVLREGVDEWQGSYYSVGDAMQAGLWTKKSPWTMGYWKDMLVSKARARAVKLYAPEALGPVTMVEDAAEIAVAEVVERPEDRREEFLETLTAEVES